MLQKKHVVFLILAMTGLMVAYFLYRVVTPNHVTSASWSSVQTVRNSAVPAPSPAGQSMSAEPSAPSAISQATGFAVRTLTGDEGPQPVTEDDLWSVYATGNIGDLMAAVAERKEKNPDWTPSQELNEKILVLADTDRLLNAASVQQSKMVMEIFRENPAILTCDRVDVLNAVTEAVYREQGSDSGVDMFMRNMKSCLDTVEGRVSAVASLGRFMTSSQVSDIKERLSDPALDAAFAEAQAVADVTEVQSWLSQSQAPIFIKPGDDMLRPGSVRKTRPVPGGSEYFPEASGGLPEGAFSSSAEIFGQSMDLPGIFVSTSDVPESVAEARTRLSEQDLPVETRLLLAWYDYASGNPRQASKGFSQAAETEALKEEAARGDVLSRLAYEDYVSAEALLPEGTDESILTDTTYLLAASQLIAHADRKTEDLLYREGLTLTSAQAERIQKAAIETKDWDLTEKLGWHSHRLAGCAPALPWWRAALNTNPDLEGAAFGIANCQREETSTDEMQKIRAAWSEKSARIAEIFGDVSHTALAQRPLPRPASVMESAQKLAEFGEMPRVLVAADLSVPLDSSVEPVMDGAPTQDDVKTSAPRTVQRDSTRTTTTRARSAAPSANSSELRQAWGYMEAEQNDAAAAAFRRALTSNNAQVRADAAYGLSLVALRKGDYQAAQEALSASPQSQTRRSEIAAGILSAQAVDTFRRKNNMTAVEALDRRQEFAEETPDLMTIRGWALWNNNKRSEALRVWRRAADAGDRGAQKALRDALQ